MPFDPGMICLSMQVAEAPDHCERKSDQMGYVGPGIGFSAFMFCVGAYYRSVVTMLAAALLGTMCLVLWYPDWRRRRDARRESGEHN